MRLRQITLADTKPVRAALGSGGTRSPRNRGPPVGSPRRVRYNPPGHPSPRSRHPSRIPRSRPVSHRPRRSHLMTAGNTNRQATKADQTTNQEQVRDLAGAGVVVFAWVMGTALLRVMRGIVAPAHGTGPTTPRPPLRACPRHPPLGLGSAGLVGGFRPATASVWKSRFYSWVETLAYPIGIAPAPRRFFPIPAGASLTNSRRAGQGWDHEIETSLRDANRPAGATAGAASGGSHLTAENGTV